MKKQKEQFNDEIDDRQKELDRLDFTEDSSIRVDGKDYRDIFLDRIDKVQGVALDSDLHDEEVAKHLKEIANTLAWVDESNIDEMRDEIDDVLSQMERNVFAIYVPGTEMSTEKAIDLGIVVPQGNGYFVKEGWEFGDGGFNDQFVVKLDQANGDEMSMEDAIAVGMVSERDGVYKIFDPNWELADGGFDDTRIVRKGSTAAEAVKKNDDIVVLSDDLEVEGTFIEDVDLFPIGSKISANAANGLGLVDGKGDFNEGVFEKGWAWVDTAHTAIKKWNLDYSNLANRILDFDDAKNLGVVAKARRGGEELSRILGGWEFGRGYDGKVYLVRTGVGTPSGYFSVMPEDLDYDGDGVASEYISYNVTEDGDVERV